jgi:cytochrome c-type biogenesis protein CcmH
MLCSQLTVATDLRTFNNAAAEQQYQHLISELRCPKCQNQNIADSNAPLAQDLRQRVYDMTLAGHSRADISEHLISRYGEFISYRPRFKLTTLLLWLGPPVIFLLAGWRFVGHFRRRTVTATPPPLPTPSSPTHSPQQRGLLWLILLALPCLAVVGYGISSDTQSVHRYHQDYFAVESLLSKALENPGTITPKDVIQPRLFIRLLRHKIRPTPEHAPLWHLLGMTLMLEGNMEEGIAMMQKAADLGFGKT